MNLFVFSSSFLVWFYLCLVRNSKYKIQLRMQFVTFVVAVCEGVGCKMLFVRYYIRLHCRFCLFVKSAAILRTNKASLSGQEG